MSAPEQAPRDVVVLPAATRDFILAALGEASRALSLTHGLVATRHIQVREGMQLTQDNSFRIDHVDHVLLMNLIQRILSSPRGDDEPRQDSE